MGSKPALVLVCLLLVAGASVAWFLASDRSQGSGGAAAAPTAARERAAPSARPSTDLKDGGGLVGSEERPAQRELVAQSAPRATAPEPAAAPVGPRLSGRIVDPLGRPVADASIAATDREGLPLDVELAADSPFADRRVATRTDASGAFTLAGLRPGNLGILVRKEGYAPYSEGRIAVPDVEAYALPEIVLHPGAILEGRVVDPYGVGVANARLHVEDASGPFRYGFFFDDAAETPSAVTAADGTFRLAELALGAWRVRVESDAHPDRTFEGLAERAGEVMTRTFELESGDALTGRVTGIPEQESGPLIVRASRAQSGDVFGSWGPGAREADVGPDGAFALAGLHPGAEYVLQVHVRETGFMFGAFGGRTRSERVNAVAGASGLVIPYQPEGAVGFQVVDASTGAPIEAFEVRYGFRWLEPLRSDGRTPLGMHPEGRVRIGNLRPQESPAHLDLQIDAVGYRRLERNDVAVSAGREIDLGKLRLEPLPLVVVRVIDETTNEPVAGAEVHLEEEEEPEEGGFGRAMRFTMTIDETTGEPAALGEPGQAARTDEEGVARLNSKPGKRCALSVTRDGYAPARVEGLLLPADESLERTIALGPGGAALVRVVDEAGAPVLGVRIDHRAPDAEQEFMPFFGGRAESITDAAGEVRFDHLAPGEHRFRIHREPRSRRGGMSFVVAGGGDEAGWASATVVAGETAEVVLVRGELGALRGRVTESGADLSGAVVRAQQKREGDELRNFRGFGGGEGERTDSGGLYRLTDLEPGVYELTVEHPKRRMPMTYEVEIEAGENRFDVDLPVSIVEGRVVDQAGKPLANVEVAARRRAPEGRMTRAVMFQAVGGGGNAGGVVSIDEGLGDSVRTDADGRYSLRGVAPDVDLVVRATGDGVQPGESEAFQVAPDQVRRGVDLKLEAAGAIEVRVTGKDGKPADYVFLRATYVGDVPEGGSGLGADPKFTAVQNGKARLTGLRPGRWSVAPNPFGAPGEAGAAAPDAKEVVVEAGEDAQVAFEMP